MKGFSQLFLLYAAAHLVSGVAIPKESELEKRETTEEEEVKKVTTTTPKVQLKGSILFVDDCNPRPIEKRDQKATTAVCKIAMDIDLNYCITNSGGTLKFGGNKAFNTCSGCTFSEAGKLECKCFTTGDRTATGKTETASLKIEGKTPEEITKFLESQGCDPDDNGKPKGTDDKKKNKNEENDESTNEETEDEENEESTNEETEDEENEDSTEVTGNAPQQTGTPSSKKTTKNKETESNEETSNENTSNNNKKKKQTTTETEDTNEAKINISPVLEATDDASTQGQDIKAASVGDDAATTTPTVKGEDTKTGDASETENESGDEDEDAAKVNGDE